MPPKSRRDLEALAAIAAERALVLDQIDDLTLRLDDAILRAQAAGWSFGAMSEAIGRVGAPGRESEISPSTLRSRTRLARDRTPDSTDRRRTKPLPTPAPVTRTRPRTPTPRGTIREIEVARMLGQAHQVTVSRWAKGAHPILTSVAYIEPTVEGEHARALAAEGGVTLTDVDLLERGMARERHAVKIDQKLAAVLRERANLTVTEALDSIGLTPRDIGVSTPPAWWSEKNAPEGT